MGAKLEISKEEEEEKKRMGKGKIEKKKETHQSSHETRKKTEKRKWRAAGLTRKRSLQLQLQQHWVTDSMGTGYSLFLFLDPLWICFPRRGREVAPSLAWLAGYNNKSDLLPFICLTPKNDS